MAEQQIIAEQNAEIAKIRANIELTEEAKQAR